MKLILENIGMLKHAEIEIGNLSVIAGENDNGKSTIGKVVFCIIKAINKYKEDLQESKEYKVNEKINEIFFLLRRSVSSLNEGSSELVGNIRLIRDSELKLDGKLEQIDEIINNIESQQFLSEYALKELNIYHTELIKLAVEPEDINKSIESALNKVFASEFDSSIILSGEKVGFIKLFENDLVLLDVKVSEGNKIKLLGEVEPIELKDATFIETPLILNYHDLLVRSQSSLDISKRKSHFMGALGIPYTTLHTKDLFDKLKELPIGDLFNKDEDLAFKNEIYKIVNGEVLYDNKNRDFIFIKNGKEISIKNTAGGIKVFGMIKLLYNNGFVDRNTMLIFDEPENHLHPKWQLKLAEILVDLASKGVYIIISSHSPYMIEALKRFSDKKGLESNTGFYLAENNIIENYNKLEDIFRILSEPFETFRKMDQELLQDE